MSRKLLVTLVLSVPVSFAFKKCCKDDDILDLHSKECISSHSTSSLQNHLDIYDPFAESQEPTSVDIGEVVKDTQHSNDSCLPAFRYLSNPTILEYNKNLYVIDPLNGSVPLPESSQKLCLDNAFNRKTSTFTIAVQICLPCSGKEHCLNYCCPEGTISEDGECVQGTPKFNATAQSHRRVNLKLHCDKNSQYSRDLWQVTQIGEMKVEEVHRNLSEYCIEETREGEPYLLLCPMEDKPVDYNELVKIALLSMSTISILIVITFYVFNEELRDNNFTKLQIPLYICLFFSFLLLLITTIHSYQEKTTSCVALGLLIQFFSLSIFFWFTSMSFDIWLGFRHFSNPLQNRVQKKAHLKLRTSFFYAFSLCGPLIITTLTGIFQFTLDPEDNQYYPRIEISCMIYKYWPKFLYLYLVICFLLVLNVFFYVFVVCNFACGIWCQDSFGCRQRRNLRVCAELVVLMGLNWLPEVIQFFIDWYRMESFEHPILKFFGYINWSIGILILILFLSKPSNRSFLRNWCLVEVDELERDIITRSVSIESSASNVSS